MSLNLLREKVAPLNLATSALAALGAAIDGRMTGRHFDPQIQPHVDAVLDALGVRQLIADLDTAELAPVFAEIRLTMLHGSKLLQANGREAGWTFADHGILQAAGDTSVGFATVLQQKIVPALPGLAERLDRSGAFLDIGAGVAAFSIAMARLWPTLRVVGVEPWPPSIALARENLRTADCGDRIELREQRGEEIRDASAFDLAWVPSVFISAVSLEAIVRCVNRALRPGGWVIFAMINPGKDPLAGALARLRTMLWGGTLLGAEEAQGMLEKAGYRDVQRLPTPPSVPVVLIAGRRE